MTKDEVRERDPYIFLHAMSLRAILYSNWWELYKESSHYERRMEKGTVAYEQLVYDRSLPIFKEFYERCVHILAHPSSLRERVQLEKDFEDSLMAMTNFYWIALGAIEVIQKKDNDEDLSRSTSSSQQVPTTQISTSHP